MRQIDNAQELRGVEGGKENNKEVSKKETRRGNKMVKGKK